MPIDSSSPTASAPQPPSTRSKLTLVASLYVAQAIPLGFFLTAVPVILRGQGLSHETVGLFAMVAMPWILKWIWAPWVDRFGTQNRGGHYRSWILVLQGVSVASVAVLAVLDPGSQLAAMAAVASVFMLVSATQDVATDGLSVRVLRADERGIGNGLQVGGYYLGQVLGGGAMLVAFSRFGWTVAVLAMAAFLALPLVPTWRFREPRPAVPEGDVSGGAQTVGFRDLGRFLARAGGRWIAILLVFRAGEAMALFVYHQHLVDLGLGLDEIGFVVAVFESLAALGGALLGGWLVGRLGRRASLLAFGALQCAALCGLLGPALGADARPVLYAAAVAVAFAGGMATAALYTAMMDGAELRTAGTDFTLQQSLAAVGPMVGTGLSGFVVAGAGYQGLYLAAASCALVAVVLVAGTRLPRAEEGEVVYA